MKCDTNVQVSYTNDLWVIQEVLSSNIQFLQSERSVKIVFVYDYVSQFIFDARIYVEGGILEVEETVLELAEQFGLPKMVMIGKNKKGKGHEKNGVMDEISSLEKEMERLYWYLGIAVVDEVRSTVQEGLQKFVWECEKEFAGIDTYGFEDLEELRNIVGLLIQDWNEGRERRLDGKAPVWRFWRELYNHVYLEKGTLWEGYGKKVPENREEQR